MFPRGLFLKPLLKKGDCKATVIIARWPPLALQNWRPLIDLVLTSIRVSSHPPHNLPCEKWWGRRFSRRRLDPEAGSTGLQVTSSKSNRPDIMYLLMYEQIRLFISFFYSQMSRSQILQNFELRQSSMQSDSNWIDDVTIFFVKYRKQAF